jgi:hypothetical protein
MGEWPCVPEGQADSSQVRSAWTQFGHLQKVMWSCGQEIFAPKPKGLEASAPGFQPWECHPERRALKGRQIEDNNAAVESNGSMSQLRTRFCATFGTRFIC